MKTKDTYGSLGTESVALREELERLAAAIERAAKSEGAEAMKAAGEIGRASCRERVYHPV